MTDRWDTPARPGAAAPRPDAPPAGRAAPEPRPPSSAARQPSPPTPRDAPRRVPADGLRAGAASAACRHFDHDAPTAKLPAVPKPPPKREPVKKPGPFPVIAGSAGLFFAVAALLGVPDAGRGGPGAREGQAVVVAQATPAPRKVLVRRVIVTRIVEHRPRRGGGRHGGTRAAPRRRPPLRAPAPAAPAPAPAAPAPAPRRPADHPVLMTDTPSTAWARTSGCSSPTRRPPPTCRAFLARLRGRAQPLPPRQRAEPAQRRPGARGRRLAAAAHGDLRGPAGGGAHRRARRPDADPGAGGHRLRPHAARTRAAARRGAAAPRRPARPAAPNPLEPWRHVTIGERTITPPARPPARHRRHGQGPRRGPARAPARTAAGRSTAAATCGSPTPSTSTSAIRSRARPRTSSASRTAPSPPRASTPGCGARPTARRATTSSTRARCSRPGPA